MFERAHKRNYSDEYLALDSTIIKQMIREDGGSECVFALKQHIDNETQRIDNETEDVDILSIIKNHKIILKPEVTPLNVSTLKQTIKENPDPRIDNLETKMSNLERDLGTSNNRLEAMITELLEHKRRKKSKKKKARHDSK